jgi:serine/threonine-protein kinase PknG
VSVGLPDRALASVQTAVSATGASRRTASSRSSGTTRSRLGAGLVDIPPVQVGDPATAVLADPTVDEARRFCARCDSPVGRTRQGEPGRTEGFCPTCGAPFSFRPKLAPDDVVAGQYEIVGCLAHGGMGWVYLAKDRNVSDRWVVLKGLLNAGDDGAMTAALAERRFLAEVEHPNIVKIFNFVEHDGSGYIVMEYVGGTSLKQILSTRREANGGNTDPLPVAEAAAYIVEILPAFAYLHRSGLLFCDFKLDNVIHTQHSLKLIDLGGVYRLDDRTSPVYGTVGYQAPEITETGPTVASDLYTVARTLAVMSTDFKGYQSTYKFSLPARESVPVFQQFDSLYRFLSKGTAPNPDDRFQSADEMSDQLLGVLREVVAEVEGAPVPAASTLFTGELRAGTEMATTRSLPLLLVSADDSAAGYLAALGTAEQADLVELLERAPDRTVEVDLRLVRALADSGDIAGARDVAARIADADPWEWRVAWYRGIAALDEGDPAEATRQFGVVYGAVPGELAPKLALGIAAESAGEHAIAAAWYAIVARTDRSYASAIFGLARCRLAEGNRAAALEAYATIPESSSAYVDAQIARIECLVAEPSVEDLRDAATRLEALSLPVETRARLSIAVDSAALDQVRNGHPDEFDEYGLCVRLESSYRELARFVPSKDERVRLVDAANRVRPRSWR